MERCFVLTHYRIRREMRETWFAGSIQLLGWGVVAGPWNVDVSLDEVSPQ